MRIRFHAILGLTIVLVATALTAGYFLVHSGAGNGRGGRLAPDRICPVRSCAGYPEPDQVRGITLATLTNYIVFSKAARAQIRAAHAWRANAVRIQVVQDKLVGQAGRKLSPGYLADVRRLVDYALRRHLTVILNATTELSTGFPADENLPTRATYSTERVPVSYRRSHG